MKHTILCLWLIAFAALPALAQPENFRVGETIETNDGRVCKILSITGRSAKVGCGANRSDVRVYSFESMTSEQAAQAKREQLEKQRQDAANAPPPQTIIFKAGDKVITPDGRTGVIDSFKDEEMAKVRFAANETNYFFLKDLKKPVDSTKPTFRVGDKVFKDGQPGVIEAIERNGFKVRYGSGKYDFKYERAEDLMSPQAAAENKERERQDQAQKPLRAQFRDETQQFDNLIYKLANAYNPKYGQTEITIDDNPATFAKWQKDLEALAAICQKYPNMTNSASSSEPPYDTNIRDHPADWCRIAEQRTALIKKTRLTGYAHYAAIDIKGFVQDIDEAMKSADGSVSDEVQMMLFERAAWEQKNLQTTRKRFASVGETIPPEVLKPLDEKVAELKAKIEQDALNRSWTQPNFKDVALEALGRREIPTDFPGAKVFKTGMTYTTWEARDTTTYVGSDSKFRFYRITPGAYRYKRGLVLVQLPNRPFCQIREFQVTQYKAGAGYGAAKASGSLAGIFVKCP